MEIGYFFQATAFVAAGMSVIASIWAARKRSERSLEVASLGVYAQPALLTGAVLTLLYYFISRDFSIEYVAAHSNRSLPLPYTISALWGGSSGSLLLWSWILSLFLLGLFLKEKKDSLTYYALSVISSVNIFFLSLLLFVTDPFKKLGFIPEDGMGLNPLLLNPGMLYHPPTLFIGYAGLTIPFAFALAGLLSEREVWIYRTRKWNLLSWIFLSLGIFFGGLWSYTVLGWGGYWAWDPVENSSLIPWLTSTALLHSAMIQESKKGMKLWNILLSILTFEAVIFATFLTRSGVLSSVHAFGESETGPIFSSYMIIMLLLSMVILIYKSDQVRSMNIFESISGRESSFLLNNLLFVVTGATVFWGTVFPLLNEALGGRKVTVGPEFYNQVTSPIMLLLVLLMGVCITLQWRRTSTGRLWHRLRYPLIISIVFPIILYFIGFSDPLSLIGFSATAFAFSLHIQEYLSDCRSLSKTTGRRFAKTLYSIILKNRRRYGGYIIHVSMVLIFFGIIGSALYDSTVPVSLKENVPLQVGDYQFIFKGGIEQEEPERSILTIKLDVGDGLGSSRRLTPRIMNDFRFQSTVVQVDILSLPFEDIYVIPEGIVGDVAKLRIRFVPLINFIWLGGVVMAIGAVICLLPRAKKEVQ